MDSTITTQQESPSSTEEEESANPIFRFASTHGQYCTNSTYSGLPTTTLFPPQKAVPRNL